MSVVSIRCLVKGSGVCGIGWVGHTSSRVNGDTTGTESSSIGKSDSPVSRLNKKTNPDLVSYGIYLFVIMVSPGWAGTASLDPKDHDESSGNARFFHP